ncbi:MAG: GNAT family N-acetyltransferase [Dehalococcoidia bacterium]|nr:GNAT family N-acetyltransferase [Dehalococcoidia bacterium]
MSFLARAEAFEAVAPEWERLALAAKAPVFATPAWQRAWWQAARTTQEALVLAFREDGALRGVAPLMRDGGTVRFMALPDVCDFHAFVYAPEAEGAFFPALARALAPMAWDALVLDGVAEDSPALERVPAAMQAQGWRVEREREDVSPYIDLPGTPEAPATFDTYLESLPGKDRQELRRKLRRLGKAGVVRCVDAASQPELGAALETFLALMRSSREEKARFLSPERERFFRTLAQAMAQEGWLRLFFLELDGTRVAGCLCFDYDGAYNLYNSGFDTRYAGLSAGLMLKVLCIQEAISQGHRRFSFLRGAEQYKYDLGAKEYTVYRLTVRR